MKKTAYLVQIKLCSGRLRYVKVCSGPYGFIKCVLVSSRSSATQLQTFVLADLVSRYFWENFWDREKHDQRSVVDMVKRS